MRVALRCERRGGDLLTFGVMMLLLDVRRCGVVLTDSSYYTIPSLDECDAIAADGVCMVTNFTIGRQEYGEIHFPGSTNIFGLNLDKIGVCPCTEGCVHALRGVSMH